MDNSSKEHQFIEFVLPHLNFEDYDLVNVEEQSNIKGTKESQEMYPTRLFVTVKEKSNPPDKSGGWYAHGFVKAELDDRPIRTRTVTIIEKRRRRKNRESGETIVSNKRGFETMEGTKKAEDQLCFLK